MEPNAGEKDENVDAVLGDKWRIDALIGAGGTAKVYAAHHDRIGNRVAVKILSREAGLSSKKLARFQREGYVANRVGHPGAVQVFDSDVDAQGRAFLVMELLAGETIAARAGAKGSRLPPDDVLDLADRLLDVLAAAHDRSILHRDIKPENLFITESGTLKVLDFGIARLTEPELGSSKTENGTVLGSPAYMAPEQARGRVHEIDPRTDLWAVGATMFTLLTGRFVHEAPTPNEQLAFAVIKTAPSLGNVAPHLPKPLVDIVDRALAYERDERWPDARAMQRAIRSVRSGSAGVTVVDVTAAASPAALRQEQRSPTTLSGEFASGMPVSASGSWHVPTTISVEVRPEPYANEPRRKVSRAVILAALAALGALPLANTWRTSSSRATAPGSSSAVMHSAVDRVPPAAIAVLANGGPPTMLQPPAPSNESARSALSRQVPARALAPSSRVIKKVARTVATSVPLAAPASVEAPAPPSDPLAEPH